MGAGETTWWKVWRRDGGAGIVDGMEFLMRELPTSSTPLPVQNGLREDLGTSGVKTEVGVANSLFHCSEENQMPPGACET